MPARHSLRRNSNNNNQTKTIMSTNGYKTKDFGVPVKRYCQTMRLKDDAELIRKYREAHDKEHFWDEIKQGIKAVGILEMEIYILGNTLFI